MKLSEMSGRLKETSAQLETLTKAGFSAAPSLGGAASGYVLTLAEDLQQKLLQGPKPADERLQKYHTSAIYEIGDHLFLATQGLELFSEAVLAKRYDEAFVALLNILIDTHIVPEQQLALGFIAQRQTIPISHDLEEMATGAGATLNPIQRAFLRSHKLALLWVRYPNFFGRYYQRNGIPIPAPLRWIQTLSKPVVSKQEMAEVITGVFRSFEHTLNFALDESYQTQKQELQGFFTGLQNALMASLDTDRAFPSKIASETLVTLKAAKDAARAVPHSAPVTLIDAAHYLTWLETAERMRLEHSHPRLGYLHLRSLTKIDAGFEQVYRTRTFAFGIGQPFTHDHNLRTYHEALQHVDQDFLSSASQQHIEGLAQGIASHYIHVQDGQWSALCRQTLETSKGCVLAPEGFTYASAGSC